MPLVFAAHPDAGHRPSVYTARNLARRNASTGRPRRRLPVSKVNTIGASGMWITLCVVSDGVTPPPNTSWRRFSYRTRAGYLYAITASTRAAPPVGASVKIIVRAPVVGEIAYTSYAPVVGSPY